MADGLEDEERGRVVAMQFAGGMSVAELAAAWERDAGWVEDAIRRALRELIPERDGGLKSSRAETRAEHADERERELTWARDAQGRLRWPEK